MMQRNHTKKTRMQRRGIALVTALIFIMVFMAMAAGMMSMSSQNVIAASNLKTSNLARSTAESGLEMIRYWMSDPDVCIPGLVSESQRYTYLLTAIGPVLQENGVQYTIDGTLLQLGSSDSPISIDSATDRSFYARISPDGTQGLLISVTGQAGDLSRTLNVGFSYGTRPHTVFDFGVATKGPLSLGNLLLDGVNASVEADVYIESMGSDNSLTLKNAQIAGNVKIVNPNGAVDWGGGQSSIGGEADETLAVANHVEVGVEETEFPTPNPTHFEQYVNGITIDSTNIASYNTNAVLENVRIAAGTNPTFTGNTVIKGVLYIEQPNVVNFGGNADITGVIVGNGDVTDSSGTNQITFNGTVNSSSVSLLPAESQYTGLQDETGTFLMAPGFSVDFGGDFGTLNGCIVANGISTSGNAGGYIKGSVVNYSPNPMDLSGSDLSFDKSGTTKVPAGFIQDIVPHYNPSTYSEGLACSF